MSKKKILYDGKAKTIFEGPSTDTVIQYFKDDTTANNAEKHSTINGKGVLNNSISDYLMKKINEIGIPTHYIKKLNMREQLVRKVEIIPVEFVFRNIAAGSIVKRLGIKEGSVFSRPLIEHYFKKDELGDPLINEDHIIYFQWGTRDELDEMQEYGLRINDFLRGLFFGIGLKLVDFKIEFGRFYSQDGNSILLLADEISPDNCRLWDVKTNKKMDKDLFRQELGGLKEAYQEIANRLGVLPKKKNILMPSPNCRIKRVIMKVVVNISLKEGVLDPEGKAIKSSLNNLGFEHCNDVRTGKQIILNFDQNSESEVLIEAKRMCEELLVNTVIENYKINILKD